MFSFQSKKNKAGDRLHPVAERLAATMAERLLRLQQHCAGWLDRSINPRPVEQKKTMLIVAVTVAGCWSVYLVITGLSR